MLIIDTSYLIYKAYFAYPNLTYQEQPTGAIYGFIKTILKLVTTWQPKILVFACDQPEKTWRHELFSEYKAGRPEIEDNMLKQIPIILEWCQMVTPNYLAIPGFEADDLIWTVIKKFHQPAPTTEANSLFFDNQPTSLIFSADRDLYQLLILPEVKFIHSQPKQTGYYLFSKADFYQKYQIQPQQWIDYKALVGDHSDNLSGIPGIGPKTATKILQQIEHLQYLFDFLQIPHQLHNLHANPSPESLAKVEKFTHNPRNRPLIDKIISHQKILEQTYLLASLREVPEIKINLTPFNLELGKTIVEKYHFQSLLNTHHIHRTPTSIQNSLF